MRKFLYTITILIVLAAAVLFALRMYSDELTRIALVPSSDFEQQDALAANAYASPAMWFSRPGMGALNDPARWQPLERTEEGADETAEAVADPDAAQTGQSEEPDQTTPFAVFFVHPTSYFDNRHWNAPLDETESQEFARIFIKGFGSAFNQASEIWAPRYRQATFGAFLSDSGEAQQAIDAAYRDVELAFDYFVQSVDADTPIVLAGHSQGSLHVLRLLRERIAGSEIEQRIVMAYPIGWPISVEHDLPGLPLPACATPDQAGCIVSWASFADGGDPGMMLAQYKSSEGFDGEVRADSPILCVNPVSGTLNGSAPASDNLGTLVPDEGLTTGELVIGAVPATCREDGLLMIGDPPEMGSYVLPLNNYHVYDIPLFWRNLQQDVVRRVSAWQAQS